MEELRGARREGIEGSWRREMVIMRVFMGLEHETMLRWEGHVSNAKEQNKGHARKRG